MAQEGEYVAHGHAGLSVAGECGDTQLRMRSDQADKLRSGIAGRTKDGDGKGHRTGSLLHGRSGPDDPDRPPDGTLFDRTTPKVKKPLRRASGEGRKGRPRQSRSRAA